MRVPISDLPGGHTEHPIHPIQGCMVPPGEPPVDFVLFPVNGPPICGHRGPGESINQAIRPYISDLGTQGAGRVRLWFRDTFGPEDRPNPVADKVIGRLGYHHRTGWYGPVAVSMEEDQDGQVPPLSSEVLATIAMTTLRGR